jgi:hypothetical protein
MLRKRSDDPGARQHASADVAPELYDSGTPWLAEEPR